jgi:hypothetical protein
VPTIDCCTLLSVRSTSFKKLRKIASKTMPPLASISMPMFVVVRLVRIRTVRHVQQINQQQSKTKNSSLGFSLKLSWEMCQLLLPTFLSKLFSEISQAPSLNVSCTLPNAFFYKSENDIFPPKCLFTSLNPKSKGQYLILHFQDQGS